jgi:hypothetical protein
MGVNERAFRQLVWAIGLEDVEALNLALDDIEDELAGQPGVVLHRRDVVYDALRRAQRLAERKIAMRERFSSSSIAIGAIGAGGAVTFAAASVVLVPPVGLAAIFAASIAMVAGGAHLAGSKKLWENLREKVTEILRGAR